MGDCARSSAAVPEPASLLPLTYWCHWSSRGTAAAAQSQRELNLTLFPPLSWTAVAWGRQCPSITEELLKLLTDRRYRVTVLT